MLGRQTLTSHYWTDSLQITDADVEHLFSIMLEGETPLDSLTMARLLIEDHVRQEEARWRKRLAEGELFQPKNQYQVGQKLLFPALGFSTGKVIATRPGSNPEHGTFTVIEVQFEDGVRREFASMLASEHKLNLDNGNGDMPLDQLLQPVDVPALQREYERQVQRKLDARLQEEPDAVYAAGLWFVRSLLPKVTQGHTNLAEALLDMNGGGPLPAEDILSILDLPGEINPTLQAFALNHALYHDGRFDEVGPSGLVRWYLRRLEPEEVRHTPERLVYDPVRYDPDLLSPESVALEIEIGDECSPLPIPEDTPEQVTLTLIYPHRRAGTLPLTPALSTMFPTALEAERILITFVDGQTGDEYRGWVVRSGRYVFGLDRFYRKHKLPIGVYVHVRRTEDPGRFVVDFDAYRPRTEWITMVEPQAGHIGFQSSRRSIGAAYDDLMALGADDLERVDALWRATRDQRRSLLQTIRDILPELARLNPQSAVHAKTLYSAVNVVRRCPPGPILAALESQPEFEPVGGHYWRYSKGAS